MERITPETIKEQLIAIDPEKAADVSRWEIEIGEDSLGDPAVFVTVVYRDTRLHAAWEGRSTLRRLIESRLQELVPDRWPYVVSSAESVSIDPARAPA